MNDFLKLALQGLGLVLLIAYGSHIIAAVPVWLFLQWVGSFPHLSAGQLVGFQLLTTTAALVMAGSYGYYRYRRDRERFGEAVFAAEQARMEEVFTRPRIRGHSTVVVYQFVDPGTPLITPAGEYYQVRHLTPSQRRNAAELHWMLERTLTGENISIEQYYDYFGVEHDQASEEEDGRG